MIPKELEETLRRDIQKAYHPNEQAIDVMYALQRHYGYLSDEAMQEASRLLGMSQLELDGLATFYDFLYREPVGKYVIHVCDSVVCWMHGHESVMDYIGEKLAIEVGGTTPDGLFTLLPTACLGYCDRAPAILVNGKVYGNLTGDKIDRILKRLREEEPPLVIDR
jgi:NADH-quinone oxidoreductase subunit E